LTEVEILQQLLSKISDEYDKSVGSFFYDAEYPLALGLKRIYDILEDMLKQAYVRTATGENLDDKVAEQGIVRKPATFAIGEVQITGDNGTIIPLGTKVASANVIFSTTTQATVGAKGVTVPIVADVAGANGQVPSSAIDTFPVTIGGLVGVTNEQPTHDGFDEESDDALRQRFFEKVSEPPTSGNIYHYRLWAKECLGVGEAKVIPLWNGPGTVKVVIVDSDMKTPSKELIDKVYAYIEENRPVGAVVTVSGSTPLQINVSVHITGETSGVKAQLEAYLSKIAFKSQEVSYAQIGSAILLAPNVNDYSNLLVNGKTNNIPINDDGLAVIGNVVFV